MNKHVLALSTALSILAFTPAFAQQNNTNGVDCTQQVNANDPACAADKQQQNTTTQQQNQSGDDAASTTDTTKPKTQDQTQTDQTQTGTQMSGDLIVPADRLNSVKLMSASDYIGKTVYDQAGNNIGDVNDLIISNDGEVQAVILGVGGFLGMGEKDVAVNTSAVQMVQDGSSTRLVVEATKEALESAPSYDRSNRRYATDTDATGTTTDQTGSTTAPAPDGKVTIDCALPENASNEACVNQKPKQTQ